MRASCCSHGTATTKSFGVGHIEFLSDRVTGISTDLKRVVDAVAGGRSTARFKTQLEHLARAQALADQPSANSALDFVEGVLAEKTWWLYRRECVYQLCAALRECAGEPLDRVPDAAVSARARARHRGRRAHRNTIGTTLVVKGLEFDHAVVLWEPNHMNIQSLYVAITRGAKSLTVVSESRRLIPTGH